MLDHLKIFRAAQTGDILVIQPHGDASAFRYQDLHQEANAIRAALGKPGVSHLVIDLSQLNYFGSEFIGSLVSMAREVRNRRGKATMCAATEQMLEVLQNMSLFKLWPYFDTQPEAIAFIQRETAAK